jgi:hypothetical protein
MVVNSTIPALRRLRQEDLEFDTRLGCEIKVAWGIQ